jgi:osomolarity two-component system, response regulator SKN7
VPTQRKSTGNLATLNKAQSGSPGPQSADGATSSYERIGVLEAQVDRLRQTNEDTLLRLRDLEARYETVLGEIVGFQRNMAQQDSVMKDLIQYFLQIESGGSRPLLLC